MDINNVLTKLKKRRKFFTSEVDFQLEFAWTIKELYPDYNIRMEYCPKQKMEMHIDILVEAQDGLIPIELKYKTKACSLKSDGEEYTLKNHGAKDISCYSYLKDIQRIEELKDTLPAFNVGYAIMLTNDPTYLNKPTKPNCNYEMFSLHNEAIKQGTLSWGPNTGDGTKKGCEQPIKLKDFYTIKWDEYGKVCDDKGGKFYVIVNKISKL